MSSTEELSEILLFLFYGVGIALFLMFSGFALFMFWLLICAITI